jgi:hypothetical protein
MKYEIAKLIMFQSKLFEIIKECICLFNKDKKRKYSYLVINHKKNFLVKYHSDSTHKIVYRQYICRCWWPDLLTACWNSMSMNCASYLVGLVFILYIHIRQNVFKSFYMTRKATCCGLEFAILIYRQRFII